MESPTFIAPPPTDDEARELMEEQAKQALAVAQAVKILGIVIPTWPRKQRRALANALRLGGRGYTKSAKR